MIRDLLVSTVVILFGSIVLEKIGRRLRPLFFPYSTDPTFVSYLNILTGFILLSTLWAMIFTKGLTVLLAFCLFPIFRRKNMEASTSASRNTKPFFLIFTAFVILCTIWKTLVPYQETIESDVFVYSSRARYLSQFGLENSYGFFNDLISSIRGTTPYHYFELWLGNFLIRFIPLSPAIIMQHIVYVWFTALALTGIYILSAREKSQSRLIPIVTLFALSVWQPSQFFNLFHNPWPIFSDIWIRPNFTIYLLFLVPAFERILKKDFPSAMTSLLLLTVATITAAPAVFGAVAVYAFMQTKKKDLLLPLSLFIFFVAFYKTTGVQVTAYHDAPGFAGAIHKLLTLWKAILFVSGTLVLRLILFVILIYVLIRRHFQNDSILDSFRAGWVGFFALSVLGILIFQMAPYLNDTYQFPYPGYVALWYFSILATMTLASTWTVPKQFFFLIFACILALLTGTKQFYLAPMKSSLSDYHLVRHGYSKELIQELKNTFSEEREYRVGFLLTQEEANNLPPRYRVSLTSNPWMFVNYLPQDIRIEPLTPPEVLYATGSEESLQLAKAFNGLLPFYKNYQNKPDYIFQYIRTRQIDHLFFKKRLFSSEDFFRRKDENSKM